MVKIVSKIITIIMNLQLNEAWWWAIEYAGKHDYKFEENVTSRAQICGCGGHRAINNVDVMHRFEYRKLTRHQQATITHSLVSLFCLTGAPARNKACKLMMITFTMSVQTWLCFFFADHWSRTTECVSRSESRYRKAKNIKRENNNKLKKILIMT